MPGIGTNRHGASTEDFKSLASTYSATQACPILCAFSVCVKQAVSVSVSYLVSGIEIGYLP